MVSCVSSTTKIPLVLHLEVNQTTTDDLDSVSREHSSSTLTHWSARTALSELDAELRTTGLVAGMTGANHVSGCLVSGCTLNPVFLHKELALSSSTDQFVSAKSN